MAETIPGGAYQNADGSWVNANGKPIAGRMVQRFEEKKTEQAAQLNEAEVHLRQQAARAGAAVTTVTPAPVSFLAPKAQHVEPEQEPEQEPGEEGEGAESEETPPASRSSRSTRSSRRS